MGVGFRDLFTGANGTLLSAHTPDVPDVGTYLQAAQIPHDLQGNRGRLVTLDGFTRFSTFDTDITNGEEDGEAFWDFERTSGRAGPEITLCARFFPTDSTFLGLLIEFFGTTTVRVLATGPSGTSQIIPAFAFAVGAQLRFGMTLTGASGEFWTEPYGGGTRTIKGTHNFVQSLQDANHRRVAIRTNQGGFGGSEVLAFIDTLTAPGQVPPGPWSSPAAVGGAWASTPAAVGVWASPAPSGGSWASG